MDNLKARIKPSRFLTQAKIKKQRITQTAIIEAKGIKIMRGSSCKIIVKWDINKCI